MNYKKIECDTFHKAFSNLKNAQNAREENPESIELLEQYIKANVEYYKVSEACGDGS